MTEKRYYSVDYDEQYYIFDSDVIQKGRVEEEAEYSYDVFADSMTGDEVINTLNNQCESINLLQQDNTRLRQKNKRLHQDWDKIYRLCLDKGFTEEEIIKELENYTGR